MRFSYIEAMTDPAYYAPLAEAAEEAGYDGFVIPDSICYPEESDSTYHYNGTGDREFLKGVPFLEPFVVVPAMAAVTNRLRFSTSVYKLAIRQPVVVANQLA